MSIIKNPNEARVVSVREFVDTSNDPVEVAGKVVKTKQIDETIAKRNEKAATARKKAFARKLGKKNG